MPCFGATSSSDSNIISFDSTLGGPCLRIGNPIAVLVCCKNQIFLAIAQVNWLSFASECDLHELALHLLVDSSAKVDFQVLHLVPATVIDDPEEQYDWCWSLGMDTTCEGVAGWLLHPVNPAISVRTPGNLTFLFESSFLLTMAVSLHQELLPQDLRNLPSVCFICESDSSTCQPMDDDASSACSICGAQTQLDKSTPQRVLEHMATHILFDTTLNHSCELCSLCLHPSPMCSIFFFFCFVKKGCGTTARSVVDIKWSTCINLAGHFNYATASRSSRQWHGSLHSSDTSPCSNVPRICPLCPVGSPAVWSYNLNSHFHSRHNLISPTHFPIQIVLSTSGKEGLKKIWDSRMKTRKCRKTNKSKKVPIKLSKTHSSHLALR
ncbi:hypothetical protein L208DRAFT_1332380 [Tricholoma matsutake]|nr:hypothetical protein L208DRAFT_1332380 [Tricholoma matsutake 945]